jgi:hypothetical protein
MISKKEITHNINSEWQITLNYQKESRYGLCKFIIEVCQKINLSNETASLAMLLTNFFFIKKCYFNYDKLTTACAAILLSSKTQTSQSKFNDICQEYSNIQTKTNIIGPEGVHKIKEQIGKYEIFLLKELNFNVPEEFPFDYIYVYSDLLYPDNEQEIINLAIKIGNDSYFTYANNIYKNYVVALACLVISARLLDLPSILEENFKYINNMKKIYKKNITEEEFNKILSQYNNQSYLKSNENEEGENQTDDKNYIESSPLCKKLHPHLKMDDLLDCINLIVEFYEDMNQKQNNHDDNKSG